jgi:uncharacterized protein YndB with AHSA1/START domain
MTDRVDEQITVAASPSTVWHALVDAVERRRWWGYLELAPVVGGGFIERWTGPDGDEVVTSGSVVEAIPERFLRLTWSDQAWPAATDVLIALEPVDRGTIVRVQHTGWDRLPDGARLAEEHRAGWRAHLTNLRNHAEGLAPR